MVCGYPSSPSKISFSVGTRRCRRSRPRVASIDWARAISPSSLWSHAARSRPRRSNNPKCSMAPDSCSICVCSCARYAWRLRRRVDTSDSPPSSVTDWVSNACRSTANASATDWAYRPCVRATRLPGMNRPVDGSRSVPGGIGRVTASAGSSHTPCFSSDSFAITCSRKFPEVLRPQGYAHHVRH